MFYLLVCIYIAVVMLYDLMGSHSTGLPFSEHLCHANISMLAPRVVIARVLVIFVVLLHPKLR